MKRNVDLTLRRDFKSNNDSIGQFISQHLRINHNIKISKLPWKQSGLTRINSDADLVKDNDIYYDNIIITGSKIKRQETRKYKYLYSNICECCGKSLSRITWNVKYDLCKNCSERYNENIQIAWKNKFNENENEKKIAWR